jgi:hypothetical protein
MNDKEHNTVQILNVSQRPMCERFDAQKVLLEGGETFERWGLCRKFLSYGRATLWAFLPSLLPSCS